jgi:uncharacterized protein (TIGR01777 family)
MATVLITGGTGLIGSALTKTLTAKGHSVIILTRSPDKKAGRPAVTYAAWDVEKGIIDKAALQAADYIVHLAGANVAQGRWTPKRKQEIRDSRVKSGELIVKALSEIPNSVKAVISASAIGWYGADPQIPNPTPFTEDRPADNSFLGHACRQWEAAIEPVQQLNKRFVIFRIGIVLSREGGAYAEFRKPLQFGIASVLGSGRQMVSWIHIDDIVGLFLNAIESEHWRGTYNAVAPQPVTNKELILAMAKARHKPYIPAPVPAFALKLMLGEMSVEILKSATVSSAKAQAAGYRFQYNDIDSAVKALNNQ